MALQILHEGGDVEGLGIGELMQSVQLAPLRKTACRIQVGFPVWSLLICEVKYPSARCAAFGVGANSVEGSTVGAGERTKSVRELTIQRIS